MAKAVLKVRVIDRVKVRDGTAPGAVGRPVLSPYFQPKVSIEVEREINWTRGAPRGPTVTIDIDDTWTAF